MIEQSQIDQIKKTTDLTAIIRRSGIELKRKGKQLTGLCPFHADRTPSLIIDPVKNLWNCLGACSEGGDVYKWVMKTKGLSFPEAHALLSGQIGIYENTVSDYAYQVEDLKWLERTADHYHKTLLETPSAQDYLKSRGITDSEVITGLRLGYADGSLLEIISDEGRQALRRLGVITLKGYELMRGCVVFPLLRGGIAVNLYGRRLEPGEISHLYLPGGHQGIFNPVGAKNTEEAVITESVIDACALISAGMRNVTAAYGINGLTDEIINHLK